jgi:hypothetical protein
VDVQLRVAVTAGVLRKDRHRDLAGILKPASLDAVEPPAMVPGAHVPGFVLHVRDAQPDSFLDLGPDPRRPRLPFRGRRQVARLLRVPRRGQGGRMSERDGLVHAERGVEVLHPHGPVVLGPGLREQPHPLIGRRARAGSKFGLVDDAQLGVHPRRAAQVRLAGRITRVQELAIQRLEVFPQHRVPITETEFGGAVADPRASRLAALLHRRQVVPGATLASDRGAVGSTDGFERVGGVVPAGDADDDRHPVLLSITSTIFDLEL